MKQIFSILIITIIALASLVAQEKKTGESRWVINPSTVVNNKVADLNGNQDGVFTGKIYKAKNDKHSVIVLDGSENSLTLSTDVKHPLLPRKEFTVSALINLKSYRDYSGIMGAFFDTGSKEKGWVFSVENDRVSLGLSTVNANTDGDGVMTYLTSAKQLELNTWYVVSATYDGSVMKVFINGELEAESKVQSGDILYPEEVFFEIGTYHDNNEHLFFNGSIYDVSLYNRALDDYSVEGLYKSVGALMSELPSLHQESPFLVRPYLQSMSLNSVRILMETKKNTKVTVEYDEQVPLKLTSSDNKDSELHEVVLTNLKANTNYFYRVIVKEEDGNEYTSDVFTFQTAFEGEQPITFGIISDTQNNPAVIKNVTKRILDERVQFVVHAGDIVGNGNRKHEWVNEFLNSASDLMARVPMFLALGNHDEDAKYYYDYLSNGNRDYYYTFSYGVAQFFIIDSDRSLDKGSEQYNRIEADLMKSKSPWKIAVYHHPPYSSDLDDYGDTRKGKSVYGERDQDDFVRLMEKYNMNVVINGHIHSYERTFPLRENKIDMEKGITYLVMGGAGGGLEQFAPTKTWFNSKLKSAHHYGIAQIFKNQLTLTVFDLNGQLIDHHVITNSHNQ